MTQMHKAQSLDDIFAEEEARKEAAYKAEQQAKLETWNKLSPEKQKELIEQHEQKQAALREKWEKALDEAEKNPDQDDDDDDEDEDE